MKPIKKYEVLSSALQEYTEARNWYAGLKIKGLSNRFAKEVKTAISNILKNPGAYAVRYKTVRIAHTKKFPYAIHFFIINEKIIITAIIYERRDPELTFNRDV
jgi:plasmid stabilization system protein ParE